MKIKSGIKIILVLSSWSSGSTSLAGFLDKCGAYSCPPHFQTNDPRTPNAFESKEYRDELKKYVDESTLKFIKDPKDFEFFFNDWINKRIEEAKEKKCTHIFLKHPLQIYLIDQIIKTCETQFVIITRPFKEIENTRIRRKWPKVYGSYGANILYNSIYGFLHQNEDSYMVLPYNKFRTNFEIQKKLLSFLDLNPSDAQIESAKNWLR